MTNGPLAVRAARRPRRTEFATLATLFLLNGAGVLAACKSRGFNPEVLQGRAASLDKPAPSNSPAVCQQLEERAKKANIQGKNVSPIALFRLDPVAYASCTDDVVRSGTAGALGFKGPLLHSEAIIAQLALWIETAIENEQAFSMRPSRASEPPLVPEEVLRRAEGLAAGGATRDAFWSLVLDYAVVVSDPEFLYMQYERDPTLAPMAASLRAANVNAGYERAVSDLRKAASSEPRSILVPVAEEISPEEAIYALALGIQFVEISTPTFMAYREGNMMSPFHAMAHGFARAAGATERVRPVETAPSNAPGRAAGFGAALDQRKKRHSFLMNFLLALADKADAEGKGDVRRRDTLRDADIEVLTFLLRDTHSDCHPLPIDKTDLQAFFQDRSAARSCENAFLAYRHLARAGDRMTQEALVRYRAGEPRVFPEPIPPGSLAYNPAAVPENASDRETFRQFVRRAAQVLRKVCDPNVKDCTLP